VIEIDGLEVLFGRGTPLEVHALRGLDLVIPEGQFVTVIGSNGAGKSTLLQALSGEVQPSAGILTIDGLEVTALSTEQRARYAARVFQDPLAGTCETLTVEENLALAERRGSRRGLRPALDGALRERFHDQLARVGLGLEGRLRDPMGLLSGGQRQAVSLLMATLSPMKILLLDEHTAALDPKTAAYVLELTREIVAAQKLTTLMVTHSMRHALDLGERTVMLHQGQVAFDVSGSQRAGLDVPDLLELFEHSRGEAIDDDSLLLE